MRTDLVQISLAINLLASTKIDTYEESWGKTVIVILNWRNISGAGLKLTKKDFIIALTIYYLMNII